MATNTFNNAVKIAKYAMDCLENNLTFTKYVNRKYEDMFKDGGAKGGDTVNVRIPALGYGLRHGSAASPQGYTDSYKPITLTQHGADMQFTTKELALNLEDGEAFKQNVLNPLIAPVANYIDQQGMALASGISNSVGTPGTLPSDLSPFLDGGALLDECSVPRDGSWAAVMHPRHQAGVLKGTSQYFNPQADIAAQYREGQLGKLIGGFKFSADQNAPSMTTGTIASATPAVNAAPADGASQIVLKAATSCAFNVGDVLTFAGCYAVNPVSKVSTGALKQFVVTEAATASGSAITVKVSPAFQASGVNQNIDALPQADALVYFWGVSGATTYNAKTARESLLFHPDAFGLACVDLPKPESATYCVRVRSPRLNIPIRLIQFYNGSTDQELYRLDVLFGWAVLRDQFAVRVMG